MKSKHLFGLVAILLLFFSSSYTTASHSSTAVDPKCRVGTNAPPFRMWMWEPKTHVSVFALTDHFSAKEITAIISVLENWSAVANESTSGVTFVYAADVAKPQTCKNCLTVMRGGVSQRNHAAYLYAVGNPALDLIIHATITVDRRVTDLDEISNAIAHELGHSFGLLDCLSCRGNSTVMNALNETIGRRTPSSCDVAQVRSAYDKFNHHARVRELKRLPVDEGEEPVEDDTPIIIGRP